MDEDRIGEILEIVQDHVDSAEILFFGYHDWDDVIEIDGLMTVEELDWCRDNLYIEKIVKRYE